VVAGVDLQHDEEGVARATQPPNSNYMDMICRAARPGCDRANAETRREIVGLPGRKLR